jgi:glycosyltransferase involved in cell wall biosynthesis
LISDFRDEWLDFYIGEVSAGAAPWARSLAEKTQSRIVHESDVVVAVTPSSRQRIREHSQGEPEAKFVYIPNGYDPEITVRAPIEPRRATPLAVTSSSNQHRNGVASAAAVLSDPEGPQEPSPRSPDERLIVTYLGTVYKPNSPAAYLDALDRLPDEIRSRFETRFIGRISPEMSAIFQNRRSTIKLLDFMPHAKALRNLAESDYVLAAMLSTQTVVAKTYEYLAAGRPILAVTPDQGEVARLLRETQAGGSASPDDPERLDQMLRDAFAGWMERRVFQPDQSAIERYDRRRLAGEFAELILRGEE